MQDQSRTRVILLHNREGFTIVFFKLVLVDPARDMRLIEGFDTYIATVGQIALS